MLKKLRDERLTGWTHRFLLNLFSRSYRILKITWYCNRYVEETCRQKQINMHRIVKRLARVGIVQIPRQRVQVIFFVICNEHTRGKDVAWDLQEFPDIHCILPKCSLSSPDRHRRGCKDYHGGSWWFNPLFSLDDDENHITLAHAGHCLVIRMQLISSSSPIPHIQRDCHQFT